MPQHSLSPPSWSNSSSGESFDGISDAFEDEAHDSVADLAGSRSSSTISSSSPPVPPVAAESLAGFQLVFCYPSTLPPALYCLFRRRAPSEIIIRLTASSTGDISNCADLPATPSPTLSSPTPAVCFAESKHQGFACAAASFTPSREAPAKPKAAFIICMGLAQYATIVSLVPLSSPLRSNLSRSSSGPLYTSCPLQARCSILRPKVLNHTTISGRLLLLLEPFSSIHSIVPRVFTHRIFNEGFLIMVQSKAFVLHLFYSINEGLLTILNVKAAALQLSYNIGSYQVQIAIVLAITSYREKEIDTNVIVIALTRNTVSLSVSSVEEKPIHPASLYSLIRERMVLSYFLSMERIISTHLLSLKVRFILCFLPGNTPNFFTCLASCGAACTGPEDTSGFILMISEGEGWSSTSRLSVTISQHFGFAVIVPSTHLSFASNQLSSYPNDLTVLMYAVFMLYCFDQRGWLIPSGCNPQV